MNPLTISSNLSQSKIIRCVLFAWIVGPIKLLSLVVFLLRKPSGSREALSSLQEKNEIAVAVAVELI